MKRLGAAGWLLALSLVGCSQYNKEAIESNNQGLSLLRGGRFADARDKFLRAAEEDRKFDQPFYNLAQLYIAQNKQYEDAIDALSKAIARNPNNPDYYFLTGDSYFELGRKADKENHFDQSKQYLEQARTSLNEALKRSPKMYKARFRLGQIALMLDDAQTALKEYSETINAAPRFYSAYNALATVYRNQGKFTEAEQVLREGLKMAPPGAPEIAEMHLRLGFVLSKQDNKKNDAITEYRAAIAEDEDYIDAYYNLGKLLATIPDQKDYAVKYLNDFTTKARTKKNGDFSSFIADAESTVAKLTGPAVP